MHLTPWPRLNKGQRAGGQQAGPILSWREGPGVREESLAESQREREERTRSRLSLSARSSPAASLLAATRTGWVVSRAEHFSRSWEINHNRTLADTFAKPINRSSWER